MIIIPELETVVLLVPRTGSRSLRWAIEQAYPRAMCIYRHMEADGVPFGYERWRRVGVVRHPVERLWSLYKFLRDFDGDYEPAYLATQRASVAMPFSDWLLTNRIVFTNPYDSAGGLRYWPFYSVRHSLPENFKSQWHYLRPDLGTDVVPFSELPRLARELSIQLPETHATAKEPAPRLSEEAALHIETVFAWDLKVARLLREVA